MNENQKEEVWKVIKTIEPDSLEEASCEECGETNHKGTVGGEVGAVRIIILTNETESKELCETCFNNTSLTYIY